MPLYGTHETWVAILPTALSTFTAMQYQSTGLWTEQKAEDVYEWMNVSIEV
jgi:hypothetical protein